MRVRESHKMCMHPAYHAWAGMHQRCKNPKHPGYKNWGGRGIRVCVRWKSFTQFWKDMGPTFRDGLTLDRKGNYGNYTPNNCRWVTMSIQGHNQRKRAGTTGRIRGVNFHRRDQVWQAHFCNLGKRVYLGSFNTEIEAMRARKNYENKTVLD